MELLKLSSRSRKLLYLGLGLGLGLWEFISCGYKTSALLTFLILTLYDKDHLFKKCLVKRILFCPVAESKYNENTTLVGKCLSTSAT